MSEVEDPTPATTDTGEHDEPMTAAAARKAELALPPDIAARFHHGLPAYLAGHGSGAARPACCRSSVGCCSSRSCSSR